MLSCELHWSLRSGRMALTALPQRHMLPSLPVFAVGGRQGIRTCGKDEPVFFFFGCSALDGNPSLNKDKRNTNECCVNVKFILSGLEGGASYVGLPLINLTNDRLNRIYLSHTCFFFFFFLKLTFLLIWLSVFSSNCLLRHSNSVPKKTLNVNHCYQREQTMP